MFSEGDYMQMKDQVLSTAYALMANTAPNCKIDVLIHSTTLANTPQSVMQTEINTRNVMQMENWRANAADLNPHRRVKIASVIVYSQNGNSWRVVNQGVGQNSHMALVTLLSLYEDYLSERYGPVLITDFMFPHPSA